MQKTLFFYQTVRGRVPCRKWLRKMKDLKASVRIQKRLRQMERGLYGDYKERYYNGKIY